jgi:hypothetical protein
VCARDSDPRPGGCGRHSGRAGKCSVVHLFTSSLWSGPSPCELLAAQGGDKRPENRQLAKDGVDLHG